jgi:PhnB protein
MATVNIYLNFNGNCEEAFNFYKSVFGGEFSYFSRFDELPPSEEHEIPEEAKKQILHITLPISAETSLMGSDTGSMSPAVTFGNNFSVSVDAKSAEEADAFFAKLAEGGTVIMPIGKTFWGAYFGMCTDRFGVNWMVSFENTEAQ